ncbi:MAG: cupin domain-containing protein [Anaerolineae bacterium]|nr:cupin domain-containing protein [Anaerolineae bacterium]
MLDLGEKLRAARLGQKLSLRELAGKAEVSASLLSQIENGKANPSVRSLYGIAEAMGLPVDYFFPQGESHQNPRKSQFETDVDWSIALNGLTPSQVRAAQAAELIDDDAIGFDDSDQAAPVVRASNRHTIELLGGIVWERLTPGPEENIEFLQICYEAGAKSGEKMSHHTGREFHFVLEGELMIELGFERHHLRPGDSIIFDSTVPHRLTNTGQTPMRAISAIFQ